jgi:hypothetical protein
LVCRQPGSVGNPEVTLFTPLQSQFAPTIFESINRKSANHRVKRQIHEESYLTKTATPLCSRLPATSSLASEALKECATPAALAV